MQQLTTPLQPLISSSASANSSSLISKKLAIMSLTTAILMELPLRSSLPFTFSSPKPSMIFFRPFSSPKPSMIFFRPFSSLCLSGPPTHPHNTRKCPNPTSFPKRSLSEFPAPRIRKWPSLTPPTASNRGDIAKTSQKRAEGQVVTPYFDKDRGSSAIERIVLRLRNLGLGSDDEEGEEELGGESAMPLHGDEKLGDLLQRDWVRPDKMLIEDEGEEDIVLPWEKEEGRGGVKKEDERGKNKRRVANAPTLAELTIEDEELRRLRRAGMTLREKITVPKAGITQAVLDQIHDKWRNQELVRLKFHEALAHDMKTGHEIVERRTGGLVTWRSGSVMVVFRGTNYEGPPSINQPIHKDGSSLFIPDVSSAETLMMRSESESSTLQSSNLDVKTVAPAKFQTAEEAEYNSLLDGLGPRFLEWWGRGILPVDADLLPQAVPGYKPPFRVLPTGMRSRLTNGELTSLRKLAKALPSHFALGRNRHHQGLAAAILKLWEKSLVVKIAVKPGIQNTNNKLMSEELKNLTGGVLLLRNKYFIVMYRGKDFLPMSVAAALTEREALTKEIQNVEEKVRTRAREVPLSGEDQGQALAGTLAEFYEAQARWGREMSTKEREKMMEEASRAKNTKVVKRLEHKLAIAQAKKLRAERLLAKIEASMVPVGPCDDQETITDEERYMFRRVGLRMKAYLPLGIRGVFDGVIENMHLHWKHRELVKLISKQKTLAFVEETARLLEYESGGILVAIERVPKGYAIIYYRGKNYRRPVTLRPRNLLTKAKALKRSVAMQRHEALSQHIFELERTAEQMKAELGVIEDASVGDFEVHGQHNCTTQSEDEDSCMESDDNDDHDEDS